jgi:hypothetical protein
MLMIPVSCLLGCSLYWLHLSRVIKFLKRKLALVLCALGMSLIGMEKAIYFLFWVLILHVQWVNRETLIGLCSVRRWGSCVRDIRISFWPSRPFLKRNAGSR